MPSRYTEDSNNSTNYSIGAVSDIPSTPSRVTYETASDMDASIFTCHSPSYDCSYLISEPPSNPSSQPLEVVTDTSCVTPSTLTTDVPDTTASTSHPSDPATETTMVSSSVVSTDGEEAPTEPSTEPGTSEPPSTSSQLTNMPWLDMGPHNIGDITGVAFSEIGGFNAVMGLRKAQWFLTHLMVEHESASHRLLAVRFL